MARFFRHMISENVQVFGPVGSCGVVSHHRWGRSGWDVSQAGGARVGDRQPGGVRRARRGSGALGALLVACGAGGDRAGPGAGESMRSIARAAGALPSTISRELGRNARRLGGIGRPRACARPGSGPAAETGEAGDEPGAAGEGEQYLQKRYSPEQIVARLRVDFPDDPEMWVSHRDDLPVAVRAGARRAAPGADPLSAHRAGAAPPRRSDGQRGNRIPEMVNISERPAEAADRAVPGHWEGDLIIGSATYRDRHPGRTQHRVHAAGSPARRLQAPSGPRRTDREDPDPARGGCADR